MNEVEKWMNLTELSASHPLVKLKTVVYSTIQSLVRSDAGEATVELYDAENNHLWFASEINWPGEPENFVGQRGHLYFVRETKV